MSRFKPPQIVPFGHKAVLLNWDQPLSTELLDHILNIKKSLSARFTRPRPEIINTYNALLMRYFMVIPEFKKLKEEILSILKNLPEAESSKVRLFTLPVCYHEKFGVDLQEVSVKKRLTIEEIVKRHTESIYTIYFQGFLPGFLYLGGLDETLSVPRKKEPRLKVEKGAVGLAENQTGVYPQSSAGGWQIIGNCPVNLFDAHQSPPSPFVPGDRLRFNPISLEDYDRLKRENDSGNYLIQVQSFLP